MRLYSEELSLYYEKKDDHIIIEEGDHYIEYASIPETIDGIPVTRIAKKAFLGCKLLKEVYIPDTVEDLGDFAFALCDHLSQVRLPRREIKLGQSLFKNDDELSMIIVGQDKNAAPLLAASPVAMNADYLIDTLNAGSHEWYRMWDQKLIDLLGRKDDEGYHLFVLCGEEDLHFDYDQYIDYVREKKSGLCMLRLLNPTEIEESHREKFSEYLYNHVHKENDFDSSYVPPIENFTTHKSSYQGKDSNPVFNYLIKMHGNDEIYFELLVKEGIITRENREQVIYLLGDRYPQTKAYLINVFNDEAEDDFFGGLLL